MGVTSATAADHGVGPVLPKWVLLVSKARPVADVKCFGGRRVGAAVRTFTLTPASGASVTSAHTTV